MANEGHIITDDDKAFHELMTDIRSIKERVSKVDSQSDEIGVIKRSLEKFDKRLDDLDRSMPRGSKVYMAEGPLTRTQACDQFGTMIVAAWHLKRDGKIPPSIMTRVNYPDQHTGSDPLTAYTDQGKVLVPTPVYDQIDRIIGEASIARKICGTFTMTSPTLKLPVRRSGPSVFIPGEGQQPNQTSVILEGVTLTAKTLMAIEEFTMELDEDAVTSISSFLSTLFAESMAEAENMYCFSASGTPGWKGIVQDIETDGTNVVYLGGSSTSHKTNFSAVTYNDLVNLMYKVDPKAIGTGVFVMSPMAFAQIYGMVQPTTNQPIFATAWQALPGVTPMWNMESGTPTILMGRPCFITNFMPSNLALTDTSYIVYGNFKKRAFGLRKDLSIEFSNEAFWAVGGVGVRVRQRIGFCTTFVNNFAVLKTAAS